jgi:hypothetical protein
VTGKPAQPLLPVAQRFPGLIEIEAVVIGLGNAERARHPPLA